MSQGYFITMLSQCWNSSFSWGVLWGGNGIRNQNLDAKCAHCYWGIFASWPFQWTDMHIHKHTYIHTYTCTCVIYMHMCNIHIYICECMHKHAYKLHEFTVISPIPIHPQRVLSCFPHFQYLYVPSSTVRTLPSKINTFIPLLNPTTHLKLFQNCFSHATIKNKLTKNSSEFVCSFFFLLYLPKIKAI